MRHTYSCQIRWADMDLLGHVNNVVYADYLQEARVDMLRVHARGPATGALADALVIVSNRLVYVAPLVFDGRPVQIDCWITELRAASATINYEVYRDGRSGTADGQAGGEAARTVYLRASTVMTPYVFADERPRRFTAEERAALQAYLEEPLPGMTEPTGYQEPERAERGHYPVQVRFSDVDVYGHVNNVKYFEYFQESRIALRAREIEAAGPGVEFPPMVVAQQDIEYKRPMLLRATPYDAWTWVSHLGRRSIVLEAEIRDSEHGDVLMARGRFAMVFVDAATGRPVEPSAEVRAAILGD